MANRTISTRLAIEGESEYKASLSRINSELKTQQSALKLTESQYKNNANSMEALVAKGKSLQNLYETQKEKVNALRDALANAKESESQYAKKKEELTEKLKKNREALEELKKSTGDTSEEQARLEAENASLNQQLQQNEGYLQAASKGVNNWQNDLNKAETELNKTSAAIEDNTKAQREYGERTGEAAEETKEESNAIGELASALAAAGLAATFKEIVDALKECVAAASDFEAEMSNVAAISGASGDDILMLGEKAKELGATTKFTAKEAAEAMGYMAMAGWKANEMMDGMDAVLSLASASGEDLARVSDIVTDALTAFGLTAADTGRFADILASTASNANTNVGLMGETFKYAAPLAGALGYSVEDVATMIGLMANSGIKATQAGTALRTMFSKLTDGADLVSESFGDVRIETQNSDGTMRSLSEVITDLRGRFSQMTEAEKLMNAESIVGKNAMSGFVTLMNAADGDFEKLSASISDCAGSAQRMADIKLDNLEGQMTLLSSAMDAVKVSVGEQLNPALRDLAEKGTDALTWANQFIQEHSEIVPLVGALASAMGVLTVAVAGYNVVMPIAKVVTDALTKTLAANPIGLVAIALTTAITAIGTFNALLQRETNPQIEALTEKARALKDTMADAGESFESAAAQSEAAATIAGAYITRLEELDAAGKKTDEEQREYHRILTLLCETMPELSDLIDLETNSIEGGTKALRDQTEAIKENAKMKAREELLTGMVKAYTEALVEQEKTQILLDDATKRQSEAVENLNIVQARRAAIQEMINKITTSGIEPTDEVIDQLNTLQRTYDGLQTEVDKYSAEIAAATEEQQGYSDALKAAAPALEDAKREIDLTERAVNSLYETEKQGTVEVERNTAAIEQHAAAQAKMKEAAAIVEQGLNDLNEAYGKARESARDSIDAQIGLFDTFKVEITEDSMTAQDMLDAWRQQTENLAKYTENLKKAGEYGLDQGLIRSLSGGSAESAGYLQTIIDQIEETGSSLGNLNADGQKWVDDFNTTFQGTEIGRDTLSDTIAAIQTDYDNMLQYLVDAANQISFEEIPESLRQAFADVGVEDIGKGFVDGLISGVNEASPDVALRAANMADEMLGAIRAKLEINSPSKKGEEIGRYTDEGVGQGVTKGIPELKGNVKKVGDAITTQLKSGAKSAVDGFMGEYSQITGRVAGTMSLLQSTVNSTGASLYADMYTTGQQMVNGMIAGINNRSSSLYSTISKVVNDAMTTANKTAEVASPSKRTTRMFEYVGEGMALGMENKRDRINRTAKSIVDGALSLDTGAMIKNALQNIDDRIPTIRTVPQAVREKKTVYEIQEGAVKVNINTPATNPKEIAREVTVELTRGINKLVRAKGG